MEILEYFSLPAHRRAHWSSHIAQGDWRAAAYLADHLRNETFQHRYGPNGRVFLLTDAGSLVGFCTLVPRDEILDDTLFPWIGFVYTFPRYRGHRFSEVLIRHACAVAKADGHSTVYLTSDEYGLYEKYGFRFMGYRDTVEGNPTQLFSRSLLHEAQTAAE